MSDFSLKSFFFQLWLQRNHWLHLLLKGPSECLGNAWAIRWGVVPAEQDSWLPTSSHTIWPLLSLCGDGNAHPLASTRSWCSSPTSAQAQIVSNLRVPFLGRLREAGPVLALGNVWVLPHLEGIVSQSFTSVNLSMFVCATCCMLVWVCVVHGCYSSKLWKQLGVWPSLLVPRCEPSWTVWWAPRGAFGIQDCCQAESVWQLNGHTSDTSCYNTLWMLCMRVQAYNHFLVSNVYSPAYICRRLSHSLTYNLTTQHARRTVLLLKSSCINDYSNLHVW